MPAAKLARKIYDLQRKVAGDDAPMTRVREMSLAGMLAASGDDLGAHKLYVDMLADAEAKHGADSREVLSAIPTVTSYFYTQGQYEDVEPYIQREIAIAKKLDGDHSNSYAQYLVSFAALISIRGEYAAALRLYEQALAIEEANAKSKDDMALLGVSQALAWQYWQANMQPKAIAMYDRAIRIVNASPIATVMMRAGVKRSISIIYHSGGRDDLAKPLSNQVIDMYTKEVARLEQSNPDDPIARGDVRPARLELSRDRRSPERRQVHAQGLRHRPAHEQERRLVRDARRHRARRRAPARCARAARAHER